MTFLIVSVSQEIPVQVETVLLTMRQNSVGCGRKTGKNGENQAELIRRDSPRRTFGYVPIATREFKPVERRTKNVYI